MSPVNVTFQARLKELIRTERWDNNTPIEVLVAILRGEAANLEQEARS